MERIQSCCAKASTAPLIGYESRLFCSLLLQVHQKTSQQPKAHSQNTPCLLNMHQRENKGQTQNPKTQKNTTQKDASLSLSLPAPAFVLCFKLKQKEYVCGKIKKTSERKTQKDRQSKRTKQKSKSLRCLCSTVAYRCFKISTLSYGVFSRSHLQQAIPFRADSSF
jgi:hypothetical protein